MTSAMDFQNFLATYVNTNTAPGAISYDEHFLVHDLLASLVQSDAEAFANNTGLQVLFAICCAMKRADLVPALFAAILAGGESSSDTETLELFYRTRETINIIWPFVGVPQIIPAALGLAGYLKSRGITELETNRRRHDFGPDDVALGTTTRTSIYKASANSEVFTMLNAYHGDFSYVLNAIGFGYNIGHTASLGIPLPEAELILTSALIALNATRQAGSHVKACVAFGYSEISVRAVVTATDKLARWLGQRLNPIDIGELARQARLNLSRV
ncbi:hypothetical protein Sste5346_008717 [Sporothrix stenoceras]|uniref:Carboxymuconolactone decarboxylase n=1 Tax=Sporothrix stenoceras TaxID=5173 RepID=A0ABR3YMZ9_9PEZI